MLRLVMLCRTIDLVVLDVARGADDLANDAPGLDFTFLERP